MGVQPERITRLARACTTAHSKCRALFKPVMEEIRALSKTNLGRYDACGLSGAIYSFAALVARSPRVGTKDDFLVCLKVLQQTRWVFSDNEKRVTDLRFLWNVSRGEHADETLGSPQSRSVFESFMQSQQVVRHTGASPGRTPPGTPPSPPFDPFGPLFRSPSPVKSVRSRGSSGGSFCISEGHNSPDDDFPSRKSPTSLAKVLARREKKKLG